MINNEELKSQNIAAGYCAVNNGTDEEVEKIYFANDEIGFFCLIHELVHHIAQIEEHSESYVKKSNEVFTYVYENMIGK